MQLISYRGRLAAFAGGERAYLAPHLDRLPDEHPDKRFVLALALYAHRLAAGELPGEPAHYLPARARRWVREQLMPAAAFRSSAGAPDRLLAARFRVPLDQITARRTELAATRAVTSSATCTRPSTRTARRTRLCG